MDYKENCELAGIGACRPCDLEGRTYSHGSKMLKDDLAIQCIDGKWWGKVNPSR